MIPVELAQLKPELLTLGAAMIILLLDLVQRRGRFDERPQAGQRWLGWFSALLAVGLVAVVVSRWKQLSWPVPLWDGVVVLDRLGLVFKAIFLLAVAVVSIGSADYAAQRFRHVAEYYALLFFSALGMMLMASAGDLITLYLGLELTTLSLYVLCSFAKDNPRSGEAGLKYIILGATASAVYLYGSSLIYGIAGTTQFAVVARTIGWFGPEPGMIIGAVFVLAAFGFKIAAVPFHMWAPDVYQGAPTPVTGFLSTASKAAGFAALLRVFLGPMLGAASAWLVLLVALSALSMVVGNLLALSQRDIKRMLAYSGIAQAGYALVGVATTSTLGVMAAAFFLFQYLFTNLGAFLVVTAVGSTEGDDRISGYQGLSRRNPLLAAALLVLLLSLGGIPPLSGFWAKLFVFWSAVNRGLYGLVFIGVLTSVMSLYYYLMVARAMYIEPPGEKPAVRLTFAAAFAILLCVLVVVGLAYPQPLLNKVHDAALLGFVAR
ncbi:MAG: NADH-quinone oxidoreductase subunit N [Armatimonadota bacterium]